MRGYLSFAALGIAGLAALAWAGVDRSIEPQQLDGMVMGRDFTRLLSNPSVSLSVERVGDSVTFRFVSDSSARLDEVYELGQHMQAAKRELEGSYPDRDLTPSERNRTAHVP